MLTHEIKSINSQLLDQAMTYEAYRQLIDELLLEQKTTGNDHSEQRLKYTELNVKRMERLDKVGKLFDAVIHAAQNVNKPMIWLIISEAWCGDGAQNIPFIQKIANLNPVITTKYILRDQHPEVMDEFATEGSRAIPKLICLNAETLEVMGIWGPYPSPARAMMENFKKTGKSINGNIKEDLHLWYARDKGFHLQNELLQLIKEWGTV